MPRGRELDAVVLGRAKGAPMGVVRQGAAVAVSAAMTVTLSLALGSLLFPGAMAEHVTAGVSIALYTTAVVGAVIALRSSLPEALAGIQDSTTILLALAVGSLVAGAPAELSAEARYASVLALLAAGTVGSGVVALTLGRLRLGSFIRFMPYPVVGGFLAGTGYLIVSGAFEMLTGTPLDPRRFGELGAPGVLLRWVPALLLALLLLWGLERWSQPLLLPAALVVLVGCFYGASALVGASPRAALDEGWLLGPFPEAAAWRPDALWAVQQADWSLVAGQAGALASVLLVVLVSVVLSATGLELALDSEIDVDRELRAAGWANLLSGLGGGVLGYTYLSGTVLGRNMGGRGRPFALAVASIAALFLVVGTEPLTWIPRPVLGVVLFVVGGSFLHEWVVRTWARMPRAEYAIVVAILLVVALVGFLPGMVTGVGFAIVMFVVASSRLDVVKHQLSGRDRASQVDRSAEEQAILDAARAHVHVLILHGFLFFGTAHAAVERVRARVDDPSEPNVRYVVLDLRLVTGIDSSAVFAFAKLRRRLAASEVVLVLSDVPPDARRALAGAGVLTPPDVVVVRDLDHALQWCEDRLVAAEAGGGDRLGPPDPGAALAGLLPEDVDSSELLRHFERVDLQPGEVLIAQGDPPAGLYLVATGEVSVERATAGGERMRLRVLRPGAIVGEMSLYLDTTASASVVAVTAVTVYILAATALEALELEHPALVAALHRALVATMARRLSESHRALEALQS